MALAVLLLQCGRGTDKQGPSEQQRSSVHGTHNTMNMPLNAKASFAGDKLQVSYSLTNSTAEDVLVFHALYTAKNGTAAVNEHLVYTTIENETLVVWKSVVPIPLGTQVEVPDVPYGTVLKAGSVLREVIKLNVPLRYHNPNSIVFKAEEVACKRITLRVGYAPLSSLNPAPVMVDVQGTSYLRARYHAALGTLQTSEVDLGPMLVQVHKQP